MKKFLLLVVLLYCRYETCASLVGSAAPRVSAAEHVAKASNFGEVLETAGLLSLPEDAAFKPHERQLIHQRKRRKTATHALKRLSKWLVGVSNSEERNKVTCTEEFKKITRCAILPLQPENDKDESENKSPKPTKEDVEFYCDALRALGTLSPPLSIINIVELSLKAMSEYVAESACNASISGTMTALERLNLRDSDDIVPIVEKEKSLKLPFKLLPSLVSGQIKLEDIRSEVTFKQDTFTTLKGDKVLERRLTCWMADQGVGGLAYSGKVMPPVAFTDSVVRVRDHIHDHTGIYYDCALLNLYPDGNCACKYHSDPDHGKIWSRDTVVVSVGETRRFNLRRINEGMQSNEDNPHCFHVTHGDVFYMFDDCQETFQHSVMSSEGEWNDGPRASIVFKKSLVLPGGRRGHGLSSSSSSSSSSSTTPSPSRKGGSGNSSSSSSISAKSDKNKNEKRRSRVVAHRDGGHNNKINGNRHQNRVVTKTERK